MEYCIYLRLLGKSDRKYRAFAEFTFDTDLRAVDHSGVFDDGEAQTGAAHFVGVALVDPVETLEDPVQVLGRNADSIVRDSEFCFVAGVADGHEDIAAFFAIVNGVAAQVVDNAVQNLGHAVHDRTLSLDYQ